MAELQVNQSPGDIDLTPLIEKNMSENIKHISDASFDTDVLKSDRPVLVDFWAEWCGPCKAIAPILEEVAKEYEGKIVIAKLDVDANQIVPGKFGIRGIPTLILFKNGVVAAQKVGAMAKGQLTAFIDSNI
jgi:thioredoxin 1